MRFCNHAFDFSPNCTPLSSITIINCSSFHDFFEDSVDIVYIIRAIKLIIFNCDNIYSPPNPSKQDAILRKIRGSRDQTIPGYLAPKSKYPGYEVGIFRDFWKEILWKKRKFRVMEKEIIFLGVETLTEWKHSVRVIQITIEMYGEQREPS